jgi:carbon monoxide dehydrogenase subunit G
MAIQLSEKFRVAAPVERVWELLIDPARVVRCMPGASLDGSEDERTFLGGVAVRIGAISTRYKGRVRFEEIDAAGHSVRAVAEGREAGGGTARGTLTRRVVPLEDGGSEVAVEASVELTGRVVQVGRGLVQGVAQRLFQDFAASVRAAVEAAPGGPEAAAAAAAPGAAAPAAEPPPLRVLPLLWGALRDAIARLFRRLLGRPPG